MLTGWHDVAFTNRPPSRAAICLDNASAGDAFQSEFVLVRVYEHKGLPGPEQYAATGVQFANAHRRPGQRVGLIGLNEVNNPFEGTRLDPRGYRDWFHRWEREVSRLDSTLECWWAGMSPGLDPLRWYEGCRDADGATLHAYGLSVDELMGSVRAFVADYPGVPFAITETNHGVGRDRVCDRDQWADAVLTPSLDECFRLGCQMVGYFVFDGWRQDDPTVGEATPPIARGTRIETVIREWRPAIVPPEEVSVQDWCPFAVRRPIEHNFTHGRGGRSVALLVDHIADGFGSCFNWFNRVPKPPDGGSSAHFWVARNGGLEQYVALCDTAWSNGPKCRPDTANPVIAELVASPGGVNAQTVSIEHEGKPGQPWPEAQVATSARLHGWLYGQTGLPADRVHTVGHYQIDNCTRANCPGSTFPWDQVIGTATAEVDVEALRGQTWALCDQLQAVGQQWIDAGWPSIGTGIGSNAESAKSHVRSSKGEK